MSIFSKVPIFRPRGSKFDLSHERLMSCIPGQLIPIFNQEVVPGDKFRISSTMLLRFSPLVAPIMHRVNVDLHWFYVPYRLLWSDWPKFISGQDSDLVPPHFGVSSSSDISYMNAVFAKGTLGDHFNVHLDLSSTSSLDPTSLEFNLFHWQAYWRIYNEYYRDENLQSEATLDDPYTFFPFLSPDYSGRYNLSGVFNPWALPAIRNWEKDYFTGSLPWTQKGTPVNVPVGNSAPVNFQTGHTPILRNPTTGSALAKSQSSQEQQLFGSLDPGDNQTFEVSQHEEHFSVSPPISGKVDHTYLLGPNGSGLLFLRDNERAVNGSSTRVDIGNYGGEAAGIDPNGSLYADLSAAIGVDVNTLREAFQLQKFLERDARGGTRYTEMLAAHFGYKPKDSLIDRCQFLGGQRTPVTISEVLQTSATDETSPQANQAGHGISVAGGKSLSHRFLEHGVVMGLLSVMPRTKYMNYSDRKMYHRSSRYQYYWPEFATLGEQPVEFRELYSNGTQYDKDTFGYVPRYSEYKHVPSTVHDDFRVSGLDSYHFARSFNSHPGLTSAFVRASDIPTRPFAVPSADTCWIQLYNNVKAFRPMPKFGEPGLIDHH